MNIIFCKNNPYYFFNCSCLSNMDLIMCISRGWGLEEAMITLPENPLLSFRFTVRQRAPICELADKAYAIILKSHIPNHHITAYFVAVLCGIIEKSQIIIIKKSSSMIHSQKHPLTSCHYSHQHQNNTQLWCHPMIHHNHIDAPAILEYTPSRHTPHQLSLTPPTLWQHAIKPHRSHSWNQPTPHK